MSLADKVRWMILLGIFGSFGIWFLTLWWQDYQREKSVPNLVLLSDCLKASEGESAQNIVSTRYQNSNELLSLIERAEENNCLSHLEEQVRLDVIAKEFATLIEDPYESAKVSEIIEIEKERRAELAKWRGNRLATGSNPYSRFWGYPQYARTNNALTVRNTSRDDVIVALVSYTGDRHIGDYYIQRSNTYTIRQIPNGNYYVKQYSGRDWNPEKEVFGGVVKGGFVTEPRFSSSRGQSSMRFSDDGYNYTTYELTLETTYNSGNEFHDSNVDQSEFFRKF